MWTASALTWPPACAVIQRGSRWRRPPLIHDIAKDPVLSKASSCTGGLNIV